MMRCGGGFGGAALVAIAAGSKAAGLRWGCAR
jgi:hypothetical protein